jgi:hypothetical protein
MPEPECADIVATVTDPIQDKSVREKLAYLEQEMKKCPQVEIKVMHHFSKGVYAREIFIPKGTLLTGKIHKTEHMNIISQGDISVLTENGPKRVKAPHTMVSPPGTKRAGYAHEDTVWTTIHANVDDVKDLDQLEAVLIVPDFESLDSNVIDAQEVKPCLG